MHACFDDIRLMASACELSYSPLCKIVIFSLATMGYPCEVWENGLSTLLEIYVNGYLDEFSNEMRNCCKNNFDNDIIESVTVC